MQDCNKKIVIVLGTGRCGTVSLIDWFRRLPGVYATHESIPFLPWAFSEQAIQQKITEWSSAREETVVDAGFYYLPYVNYLMGMGLNIYFICLERKKELVVASFEKKQAEEIIFHLRRSALTWFGISVFLSTHLRRKRQLRLIGMSMLLTHNSLKKHTQKDFLDFH